MFMLQFPCLKISLIFIPIYIIYMQRLEYSDVSCPILDQFYNENKGRKSVTVGLIFKAFWGHKCLHVINL